MRRLASDWLELVRAVGEAFLELVGSELTALSGDLAESGRRLGIALGILLLACFTLFWALGALVALAVELLDLWLDRWAAIAVVLGILVVTTLVLAAVGRRRLRRIDKPADTVRRRVGEHTGWWQRRMGASDLRAELVAGEEDEQ